MDMDIRIAVCLGDLFVVDFGQPVVCRYRTGIA